MRGRYLWLAGLTLVACGRKPATAIELPLPALRVVLSSETTVDKLGAGTDVARRPWVGPIIEVLAEETPDGAVIPLSRQRIAAARMTSDALFDHALANLRAANLQPMHERTVEMAKAHVQITRAADNHSAARLLLPELWSKIAADAGGRLYAAAPARDIVVWTTSMDESDQRALRGQARVAYQARSFPISPAILRWTGNGWALQDENVISAPTP